MNWLAKIGKWGRSGDSSLAARGGRVTWAHTSVGRTVSRAGVFMRRQLWIWPIIAFVILCSVGVWVHSAIQAIIKENIASDLQTLLNAETAMLDKWFRQRMADAEASAHARAVREAAWPLLQEADSSPGEENTALPDLRRRLEAAVRPFLGKSQFIGYFLADRSQKIVASSFPVLVGQQQVARYESFLEKALEGETVVSTPFPSVVMLKNPAGEFQTGEPTMYVVAPLRDADFNVVGALALQMRPEGEFTEILQLGRLGRSGETYAFDETGRMVSNSRFDRDLILLGILPDQEHARSILNVQVRDPQGDMTRGYRPKVRRAQMPLTKMAASAVQGKSGVDVEGYRDYRGVLVVGAWKWMPQYGLGVATEIDAAEAFRPLTILRRTFGVLYVLLIASAVAIFVFTLRVSRLRQKAREAAIAAKELGAYKLEEQIGAGAMGVVYRAHHAMLRRPTAIKMLDPKRITDESIRRFEQEVTITCRLNHPSTIAIYDFGRTDEGNFYYAMEYLDGIDLQTLVDQYGPQPPARVIYLLLQACGSLYEAHSEGLVHRDIKPANIMVNRRGGESDVVKVLDFGLVKKIEEDAARGERGLTGTPLYMSPEAIQTPMSVDGRSDLYALGAVAYFLLTGRAVFEASSLEELCQKQVDEVPVAPSQRVGVAISGELEYAILACLEKARSKRPQTARDLANLLRKCPEYGQWTPEDADAWWYRHEHGDSLEASRTSVADAPTMAPSEASSEAPSDGTSPDRPVTTGDSTAGSFDATMAPREEPSQKRKPPSRKKSPKRRPPKKE